ncbi:MAG: hypothetical protein K0R65_2420 [Crocinitomicaceae bacterium]|jgi:gliding motility-associated-like protein|nr:hypothetical protein [Crocinitomicaceae bacterium]
MKKTLLLSFLLFLSLGLKAQLTVDKSLTPEQLVQNILAGSGVEVSNVTFNGLSGSIIDSMCGSFLSNGTNLGLQAGMILGSGDVDVAPGPNDQGSMTGDGAVTFVSDPDLDMISTNTLEDVAVLEFDFVPSGDTVSFRYVFASEEYNEFVCSGYNDVFGFFISGPGINGPFTDGAENIARIPGTNTAVAINTVNLGVAGDSGDPETCEDIDPNWESYSIYYNNNTQDFIQYDGMTRVLTAVSPVQCGQTYHIKMAIADAGDPSYDSGVFLEAGSLNSIGLDLNLQTVSGESIIYESCTSADQIIVSRPESMLADTTTVSLTVTGVATPGVDYTALPDTITFLPGIDSVTLELQAFFDNLDEGNEIVIVTATYISHCGDTVIVTSTFEISEDPPVLTMNAPDKLIQCPDDELILTAEAGNGFDPYTYMWSNGTANDSTMVSILVNDTIAFQVTATDACGNIVSDSVFVILNQTLSIDSLAATPANSCEDNGTVNSFVSGATGSVSYNWSGPGPSGGVIGSTPSLTGLEDGWYYLTVVDNVCTDSDSIFVDKLEPPVADFSLVTTPGAAPQTIVFSNSSQNADTYTWVFGNGEELTVDSLGNQSALYPENTVYSTWLYAIQQGVCIDSMQLSFELIAIPSYITPNVFTPNGDTINAYFTLSPLNFETFTFSIFNRWGNLLFEGDLTNPRWDGTIDGKEAEEAVYFYRYSGVGQNGEVKEGHGYFHLIR